MKYSIPMFLMAASLAATCAAAPIAITGPVTYRQDFNGLGTGSPVWADDATIPGWLVQVNNGATVPGTVQASDGTQVFLNGLLNLGAADAVDRALGSKSTGTANMANIACAVQFQNTGTQALQVTRLSYAGELWRTNTTAGIAEVYTVFTATSATPITDIKSGPTSSVAVAGSGFTAAGSGADWSSPNNTPGIRR